MKIELFIDESKRGKERIKLIINDKEIDFKKCRNFSVVVDANKDNFVEILSNGGTVQEQIKEILNNGQICSVI